MGHTASSARFYGRCVGSLRHHSASGSVAPLPLHRELPYQSRADVLSDRVPQPRWAPFDDDTLAKTVVAEYDLASAGLRFLDSYLMVDQRRLSCRGSSNACDILGDAEHLGILRSCYYLFGFVREVSGSTQQFSSLSGLGRRDRTRLDVATGARCGYGGSRRTHRAIRATIPLLLCARPQLRLAGCATHCVLAFGCCLGGSHWTATCVGGTAAHSTKVEGVSNQDQAKRSRTAHDAWLLSLEFARASLFESGCFSIDGKGSDTIGLLVS